VLSILLLLIIEEIDLLLHTKWVGSDGTKYTGYDLLNLELDGSELNFNIVEWLLTRLDCNRVVDIKGIEFTEENK
jgi:hypothetical protein